MIRSPRTDRRPAAHAANAPTPGTTSPSASAAAFASAVTSTCGAHPLQGPLGRAQVARAVVEHHHTRRPGRSSHASTLPT